MIKRTGFFLLLFVSQLSVQASGLPASIHPFPKPQSEYSDGATRIIEIILETIGLTASFEVRRANVPNAAAVVYQGKRYILYNPAFIAAMDKAAGTPWAAVAVLAHEIGHHLNGHTLDGKGSLPAIELEADEFSGFVLRKMGANLAEAQVAMRIIASAKPTQTHPARTDRLMAIASGWNRAGDKVDEKNIAEKNARPDPKVPFEEIVLPQKFIAFDVHFGFDPQARYHVTKANNLVKLFNNKVQVLGKLLATGTKAYPLAFHTTSKEILFISRSGKILNQQGDTLGYMIPRE